MQPVDTIGNASEMVFRILAATLIGAVLGVNRELRDKPAGIKTHALVSLGSALLIVTGIDLARIGATLDSAAVTRVVQGIITGIGFLGGGVIMRQETSRSVSGLTTASTVWIAACLGIACGAGQWVIALVSMLATLIVLIVGDPLERLIRRRYHRDVENGAPFTD
jgi:putative Mg2+ transporter-C (MgtC) family protein